MNIQIPHNVTVICEILQSHGFNSWIVGGCVRDALLGREPHDWDITSEALPDDVIRIFKKTIPTGIEHGTITVLLKGEPYEVTTLRSDGEYSDGRHPDEVKFGCTIKEDLSRRDFTINAMAFNPVTKELVDPFGGVTDLKLGVLKAVGIAAERFEEDALRILRAARFCATHNLKLNYWTKSAMNLCRARIKLLSKERIRDEILKILSAERPSIAFQILYETNTIRFILPELDDQYNCKQNSYHKYDVWTHTMECVNACSNEDIIFRLAVLLHDIGKPSVKAPKDDGFSFLEHEEVGAEIANNWMREFKFSNEERERVVHLVRHHLILYSSLWSKSAVRRFINRVGVDNLEDFFELRRLDLVGKGLDVEEHLVNLVDLAVRTEEVLQHKDCVVKSNLAINGHDVQERLGVKPGPIVGKALAFLFEAVLDEPELNEKEKLFELLVKFEEREKNE